MTYCDFKVGDEVVCVDASPRWLWIPPFRFPTRLVLGRRYTVEGFVSTDEGVGVCVGEVSRPRYVGFGCSLVGHRPSRFRKVERKTDTLSIESFLTIKPGFEEPRRTKAPAKRERV